MLVRSVNIFVISVVDVDLLEVGVWHVETALVDPTVKWISIRIGVSQVVGTAQPVDVVLSLLLSLTASVFGGPVGRHDHVDLVGLTAVLTSWEQVPLWETVVGIS